MVDYHTSHFRRKNVELKVRRSIQNPRRDRQNKELYFQHPVFGNFLQKQRLPRARRRQDRRSPGDGFRVIASFEVVQIACVRHMRRAAALGLTLILVSGLLGSGHFFG
jgi:hypothetical protein